MHHQVTITFKDGTTKRFDYGDGGSRDVKFTDLSFSVEDYCNNHHLSIWDIDNILHRYYGTHSYIGYKYNFNSPPETIKIYIINPHVTTLTGKLSLLFKEQIK